VTAAGARIGPAAVVVALLVVPLLYVPGLDSPFTQPKLAVLLIAGALGFGGWLLAWAAGAPGRRRPPSLLVVAAGAVVATTLLSAALAARRQPEGAPYAPVELARLAAMLGVALAAAQAARAADWRSRVALAVTVSAGMVSALGLLQHVQLLPFALPVISVPGSTFGNRNIAAEAVALSIPFGLAALGLHVGAERRRARAVLAALLLVQLVYLAATRARGAWIGAGAGVVVFALVRRPALPRALWLAAIPVGAALLLVVLLPGRWIPRDANDVKRFASGSSVVLDAVDPRSPVIRTRVGLWRRTLAMWREHPMAGVGPGNFAVLFPLRAEPGATADGVMSATMVPRRPHDEPLERLAETGVIGGLAFVALFAAALRAGWRWRRAPRDGGGDVDTAAAAAGTVTAALGCGLTAFPLAMPATALLAAVALGLLAGLGPDAGAASPVPGEPRGRPAFAAAALVAVALTAGAGWLATRALATSYWLGRAEALLSRRDANPVAALPLLARADHWAGTADRFPVALRTAQAAMRLDLGAQALRAADRALAIEPHSPHAWAERAAAQLAAPARNPAGALTDAEHALRLYADHPGARRTAEAARAAIARGGR
jgi:O-antigen ligase